MLFHLENLSWVLDIYFHPIRDIVFIQKTFHSSSYVYLYAFSFHTNIYIHIKYTSNAFVFDTHLPACAYSTLIRPTPCCKKREEKKLIFLHFIFSQKKRVGFSFYTRLFCKLPFSIIICYTLLIRINKRGIQFVRWPFHVEIRNRTL